MRSNAKHRAMSRAWLAGSLFAMLAAGGCATSEHSNPALESAPSLVWPAPPDPPRIAYLHSISRPGDVGIKVSAGARALRWIFGSNQKAEFLVKPFGIALD